MALVARYSYRVVFLLAARLPAPSPSKGSFFLRFGVAAKVLRRVVRLLAFEFVHSAPSTDPKPTGIHSTSVEIFDLYLVLTTSSEAFQLAIFSHHHPLSSAPVSTKSTSTESNVRFGTFYRIDKRNLC
uniref:Secreted protein n=1 Tax=Steinernema glaseri TaxID=37863 RepID=A0A1I7Z9K4_9BILA